jgi:hypothetical protein
MNNTKTNTLLIKSSIDWFNAWFWSHEILSLLLINSLNKYIYWKFKKTVIKLNISKKEYINILNQISKDNTQVYKEFYQLNL